MIDLHVHSNRSDGSFSPRELVDYAMEKQLSAFALTDHDSVDGLDEAIEYAESLKSAPPCFHARPGEMLPEREVPLVIPGIELSTEYEGQDIHILGLAIDYKSPDFTAYLRDFVSSRDARNRKMCALLQKAGIDISYEKLQEAFPDAVITRAHYARYLLTHGYTTSMKEAFERYIGDRCPYFVPREKITPKMAVSLILQAGGIPVLAHPILYHMSDTRLETLVAHLKEAGLVGIEAIYSTYNTGDERQIRRLAAKYHLLISGGSDFHGSNKPGLDLGTGYGNLYVPDEVWENLRRSRRFLLFTDMDGTLLRSDCTVSPSMASALSEFTRAGHQLILSSGRPLPSILEVQKQANLRYPGTLIISNNGALVYDCDKELPLLEYRICQEDIAYIEAKVKEAGIHMHGYTASQIVCYGMNEELAYYTRRIHLPLKYVPNLADALPQGSYKLQIIHLGGRAVLENLRDKLAENTDLCSRVQMIFSNEKYLEILPKEAGKGNALRFVTDFLPVVRTYTLAAGDEENDISMLDAAHTAVATANATEAVKEHADIITESTCDEDGLLPLIRKLTALSPCCPTSRFPQ